MRASVCNRGDCCTTPVCEGRASAAGPTSNMVRRALHVWVMMSVLAIGTPLHSEAQSLAGVARAEQDRRKTAPRAEKVYTNENLRPDPHAPTPRPPPASSAPTSNPTPQISVVPLSPDQSTPTSTEASAVKPAADEKTWRARITAARERLQRSQLFVESLQSRINALTTDFVSRDDPAQRALIDQDRRRSLAELERVKGEIIEQTKAIADIEEEARKAGVPPGWLRAADND